MKHIFLSLFAICVSSLVRCLFKSLVHFLIGLFVFLLSFMSYLAILDNSCLSDMSFAKIFSQPLAYLLILLRHQELKNFPGGSNMLLSLRISGLNVKAPDEGEEDGVGSEAKAQSLTRDPRSHKMVLFSGCSQSPLFFSTSCLTEPKQLSIFRTSFLLCPGDREVDSKWMTSKTFSL